METLQIFDLSYDGSGVAKSGGKIIFVPKTLPGEIVEAEIVQTHAKFSLAECKKVIKSSPLRIEPKCPHFAICGGCGFQHCAYAAEQNFKLETLKKELYKIGFSGQIDFIESPNRFAYRNKIKLEIRGGKVGYFKAKTRDFFEVKSCPIANENVAKAMESVKRFVALKSVPQARSCYIKNLGATTAICFLFPKNAQKSVKNAQNLQIFGDFSVFFAFGDVLESDKTLVTCVHGKDILQQELDGFVASFQPQAFNQVNDQVAQLLYAHVLKFAKGKRVLNAYAGQGLLTYLLSKSAQIVYGIEMQKSAHHAAEQFRTKNIQHICGKVEEKLPLCQDVNLIVLDPAREGCKTEVLQSIAQKEIAEILYVSCNFSTLVRDLKILQNCYQIQSVTIFDMFPCTAGMETCVKLIKK